MTQNMKLMLSHNLCHFISSNGHKQRKKLSVTQKLQHRAKNPKISASVASRYIIHTETRNNNLNNTKNERGTFEKARQS